MNFLKRLFSASKQKDESHIEFGIKESGFDRNGNEVFVFHVPGTKSTFSLIKSVNEFENSETVRILQFGDYVTDAIHVFGDHTIKVGFILENSQPKLIFRYWSKEVNLKVDDEISYLFEDGTIFHFEVKNKPFKYENDSGIVMQTSFDLNTELLKFSELKLKKVQIKLKSDNNLKISVLDNPTANRIIYGAKMLVYYGFKNRYLG